MDELGIYIGSGDDSALSRLELSTDFSSHSLQEFMRLKSSSVLTDRLRAVREFGPDTLGKENWIIGLVGMMYDAETPVGLSRQIMLQVLSFLHEDPLFLSVSVLKVLRSKLGVMKPVSKAICDALISPSYLAHLKKHRSERLGKELRHLTLRVLEGLGYSEECEAVLKGVGVDPLAKVRAKSSYASPSISKIDEAKIDRSRSIAMERVYGKSDLAPNSLSLLSSLEMTLSLFNKNVLQTMKMAPSLMLGSLSLVSDFKGVSPISVDDLPSSHIAIVTDFPVLNTYELPNVAVLKLDPLHRVKVFSDYFESVLLKKFEYVLVVFPHSKSWSSYFFAQEAISLLGVSERVKLVDSQISGPGFQLFFDAISRYFMEGNPVSSLETVMEKWRDQHHSLVMVENSQAIQQWPWFDAIKSPNRSSIISCTNGFSLYYSADSFVDVYSHLLESVSKVFSQNSEDRVVLVYYQLEKEARQFKETLISRFPLLQIQFLTSHYVFAAHYGPFIGIAYTGQAKTGDKRKNSKA